MDVNESPLAWLEGAPGTAMQAAAGSGDLRLVRCLLEAGADVESNNQFEQGTALQFAAISGSISVATALIQNGADVRAPAESKDERTAIEGAAEHGRLDMVQLLINMGAKTATSRALHFARCEGHDGVVALLLENGFEDTADHPDDDCDKLLDQFWREECIEQRRW